MKAAARFVLRRGAIDLWLPLLAALLFVVSASAPRAASAPVEVGASIEPSAATVGDRIRLTLRVERDADTEVVFPDVPAEVTGLDVLSEARGQPVTGDGRVSEERVWVLAAFRTGSLGVPQLPFRYVTADGESGLVWSDSLSVEIESVVPDTLDPAEAGPRDIKPPVDLPRETWPIVLGVLSAAAAAALAWWLRKRLRRRERRTPEEPRVEPAVPPRAAHLIAFERLKALEADDPISRGDVSRFYVAVTEIVRQYIRDRFGVDALDMTTAELGVAMSDARIEEPEVDWAVRFLAHADLAKFAKYMPTAERARADFREAWAFVERTRFRDEEEVAPGEGSGAEGPNASAESEPSADRASADGPSGQGDDCEEVTR